MELSEKKWAKINRFIRENGTRDTIEDGVVFRHPKIPFEFRCRGPRIDLSHDPFDVQFYRHFEWVGDGWLARRSYVEPNNRATDSQTSYVLEGDIERAECDMVLVLLSV